MATNTSATARSLIVTGATGKQGGALIEALLARPSQPFEIYAVTRNKSSNGAQSLASKPNVHVIEGDFDKPETIFQHIQKPWGLFSVTTPMGRGGAKKEEAQGKAVTKAALDAHIQHIVYTSVERGDGQPATDIPHFASKKAIEDDIMERTKSGGTTWTFLRPVAFMDNLTNDFFGKAFATIWQQNGLDTKLQLISTKDIGRVAAEAFLNAEKDEYRNKGISLAGDDISPNEAAKIFKQVTGQGMPYTYGFVGSSLKWMMSDELGKMFAWFKRNGYHADIQGLRQKHPFLKDFRMWLEEESAWRKR